ncbi:MAG TPA: SDR family NAD(P)-dependent oxidoreductase, partial [Actinomycetota bacterium]|nr:SDR family NAD(P)-dependent oxidoreductase [Actinomycetota bacterium]
MTERTAVVTGGSAGLGFALAEQLGAEGIGISILGRDTRRLRDAAERLRRGGTDAAAVPCDVSRQDEVRAAFEEISRNRGLTYLFNVAGVGRFGPVEALSEA